MTRTWVRNHLDAIVLVAVSIAATALSLHYAKLDPVHGVGTVDQQYYLGWGGRIADGHLAGDNPFRTPLYPYLIGFIFAVARTRDPIAVQIVQIAVAAGSLLLVRRLGNRLFGRPAGTIASVLLLLYWPWVFFTSEIVTEPTFIALILGVLNLLLPGPERTLSARRLLLAGCILSLAILDRPNGTLLLLPALAWVFVRSSGDRHRRVAAIGWLLAGLVPLLAVNAVRNGINEGRPIPISDQAGVNFYIGNRPGTSGYSARLPGLRADWLYPELKSFTETEVGRRLDYAEVIVYWRSRALRLVRDEPSAVAANLWKKTVLFFNHYEMGNNRELYQFRRTNPVLRVLPVTLPMILALTMVGLFYTRKSLGAGLLVFAPFALLAAGVIAFFVCSRYRLPAVPFLALLGGAGASGLVTDLRARRFARSLPAVVAAVLVLLIASREVYGLSEGAFAYEREFTLGVLAVQKGDPRTAAKHFESVLAAKPSFVEAGINLANIYRDTGRYDDALRVYRQVERVGGPGFLPIVLLDEGLLHRRRGDYQSAVATYARYLEARPGAPDGSAHLTVCLLAQGRVLEATQAFRLGVAVGEGRFLQLLGRSVLPSEAAAIRATLAAETTLAPPDKEALLRVLFPPGGGR